MENKFLQIEWTSIFSYKGEIRKEKNIERRKTQIQEMASIFLLNQFNFQGIISNQSTANLKCQE